MTEQIAKCLTTGCENRVPRYAGTGPHPKYCYQCTKERRRAVALAHYYASREKKAEEVKKQPPEPKIERRVPKKGYLGTDRGTRHGFMKYWADRKFHFGQMFPGLTLKQAWEKQQGVTD